MVNVRDKIKRLDLLSGTGALVLGAGLGALLSQWIHGYAVAAVLIGAVAHGLAMFQKHRLERAEVAPEPLWEAIAYWGCWVLLLIVVALIIWA